jgi:hypothetical protein
MSENIRQRKRVDESKIQSSKDDIKRNLNIDQDDRRSRQQSSRSLS